MAALDIGESRFILASGRLNERGDLVLRAVEEISARGMEQGVLTDPMECSDTVARLIRLAEKSLSQKISKVWVGLHSGLKSYNAAAAVPVPDPTVGISRRDVEKVTGTCRTLSLDYNRKVLHSFERGFSVDGQSGIKDPIGLCGTKLGVELHLVTALTLATQNLTKVLNRAGLEVEEFVLPALAASEAVLSELDRDVGVTFIQMGEMETECILFGDGGVRETFLFPWGTDQLVDGLSRALKLPRQAAEQLFSQLRTLEEDPERPSIPFRARAGAITKTFQETEILRFVSAKSKEFLTRLLRRFEESSSFRESTAGIVMVGGLSQLEGFLEMAEGSLNMPVRLGVARELQVENRVSVKSFHTTAVGLLRCAAGRRAALPVRLRPTSLLGGWFEGTRRLLEEYF